MASPFQLASGVSNSLTFSAQRRMCELWDGSQIVASDSAATVLSLYRISNTGVSVPIMGAALSTTFTEANSTSVIADIFVVNGSSTSDIWIFYCSDSGTATAAVWCAHCTYDGNSFTFDNTGTNIVTPGTGNIQLVTGAWNGTDVIVCYRDGTYKIMCTWTATKAGNSGWQTAFQLGTSSGGSSQTHEFPMLRHSAKLAGGSAGATVLVYSIDSGSGSSHSEQFSAVILLDSASSAASANWKAEVKNTNVTGQNFASSLFDSVIDPADGDLFVFYTSSAAGTGGVTGHSIIKATVDSSGVLTWGSRVSVDTGDSLGTVNIGIDTNSQLFAFFGTGTIGTSGVIKYRTSTDDGATWSAATATVAATAGDGLPKVCGTDDLAMHAIVPLLFQRGTSTFTVQFDNTITCNFTAPAVGLTVTTFTQNDISGGPPGNGTTATRIGWQDTNGNGWGADYNGSYGGGVLSGLVEYDSTYVSVNQINHGTSSADGAIHVLAQSTGNVFTGTEDPTFTASANSPTGQAFWRSYSTGTIIPSTGPQLDYAVSEAIHSGPMMMVYIKITVTNPTGSAVTLNSTDSLEIAMLGGLTTINQGGATPAWASGNGKYATVGGTETAWPSSLTAATPDYAYCPPAAATGINLAVGCVKRGSNGLPDKFGSNSQVQFLSNGSRLKFKDQMDGSTIAGSATFDVYYLQYARRSAATADHNSIAADYINTDASSIMSVGTGASPFFDYTNGWYAMTATNNQVEFTHTISGSVDKRYYTLYKISNWTSASGPTTITLNGVALVNNTDYIYDVDAGNQVLYVKLWKVIVASGAGAGQLNNGLFNIQGPGTTVDDRYEMLLGVGA